MSLKSKTQNFEVERGLRLADVLPSWCWDEDIVRPRRSEADPDVDVRDERGMTKLHIAAMEGSLDEIRELLREGADINAQIPDSYEDAGYTPLHLAVQRSCYRIVKIFLKNRARVNVRSNYGMTPLHIAAGIDNSQILGTLIKRGAFVYAEYALPDCERYIPLHFAMKAGKKTNVRLLLEAGAKKKYEPIHYKFGDSTFRVASTVRDNVILAYVFMWHVNFNNRCGKKILINEVASDESAYANIAKRVADWLFDKFHTLNCELLLPGIMHAAAELGYVRIIGHFLERGVDVNAMRHPLHARVPDAAFGYTLLHTAANNDRNYNLIKLLMKHGADVNIIDIKGRTPINIAMKRMDFEAAKMLTQNGIIVNRTWLNNL